MLLVQTNNSKEQSSLEEEFSRQANLFIVPIKKTHQISVILEGILFQVFGQSSNFESSTVDQGSKLSQKVQKMCKFINNTLKLNFSLSLLRQIFEIIKTEEKKIKLYEQYIIQMNKRFMIDDDEDQVIFNSYHHQGIFMDLQNKFQEQFGKNKQSKVRLDEEIAEIQVRIEAEPIKQLNKRQRKVQSVFQLSCNAYLPKDQEARTMHTLKSQLTVSPKFSSTLLSQYKMEQLNFQYQRDVEQSFSYSQKEIKHSVAPSNTINSEPKIDKNSDYYFYCPQWKKQQDKNKKFIRGLIPESLQKKLSKKLSNDSKFIQNLSGKVNPIPSFLHDESIGQMIIKQKKQDLRKSNILRNSIRGVDENKNAQLQNAYITNLRQIKFQNKIKRSSKNLISKKDLKEIKQQFGNQKQADGKEIKQVASSLKSSEVLKNFNQKSQIQANKSNKQVNFFKSQKF